MSASGGRMTDAELEDWREQLERECPDGREMQMCRELVELRQFNRRVIQALELVLAHSGSTLRLLDSVVKENEKLRDLVLKRPQA